MNQKTIRKYELVADIATAARGDAACINMLSELGAIDFQTAFEMWEFVLLKSPAAHAEQSFTRAGFDLFMRQSETKTRQMFMESLPLQRLVYTSPCATDPGLLAFLGNLILSNKIDTADECLQKLRGNTFLDFGESMRAVIETVFALYCEKHGVHVPVLNKKQKTLLQSYIDKIRGPNKALLTQRMKEI